jgi:transglutaminase-like putative cysteine protease
MLLSVRSSASYDLPEDSFVLLMVEPLLIGPRHRVKEERMMTTQTQTSELWNDAAGNPQRRFLAPAGTFGFTFSATIEADPESALPDIAVEPAPREIPAWAMVYTLPSRYCQSDLLTRMASSEFGRLKPGGSRVRSIAEWVRTHVEYRYGTTDSMTSAYDTATERIGVCRDFAHLVIAFCRALGIPARYASGYALGLEPPDFHGIAQVYLSGAWHNVDATIEGVRPAFIPIAIGRDAADVAMTTLWGNGTLREQSVEVCELSTGIPDQPQASSHA